LIKVVNQRFYLIVIITWPVKYIVMPFIAAVSKINLPHKTVQQDVKEQARAMFSVEFPQADRLIQAFDNTGIVTRNFVKPLSYYGETTTFKQRNDEYIKLSLQYPSRPLRPL
jgi:alkylresorcinol/alkylpyrone synthase